tara:strand:- start:5234 stop:6220 length:987 start_codon:yes stop_codon:yes gene_type:complete
VTDSALDKPTRNQALSAQQRLRGKVYITPVLRNYDLDEECGAQLWLKAENMQRVGAFKARGAYNAISQLTADQLKNGITTYSSGNHAQAVAWAARGFRLNATIFMPTDAPAIKVDAVKALGAEVVSVGTTSLERHAAAVEFAAESGATIIEPFNHPDIIAGQATASLELQQEVAARANGAVLDELFVPVGGGGLIAGACIAFEGSPTKIIAVEPEGCSSMKASLAAGKVTAMEPGPTLADGLKPTRVGELNFAIAKDRVSDAITVNDKEIGMALVKLLLTTKTLIEPSGAAALAGALRCATKGKRVGVLLSGGNIAPATLANLLRTHG